MKYIIGAFLLIVSVYSFGEQIQMRLADDQSGVYIVGAKVNGLPVPFILDTGASTTLLPRSVIQFLIQHGRLTPRDVIRTGKASIANGDTINDVTFNIRDFQIGNTVLHNVEIGTMLGSEDSTSFLLGQNVLRQFSRWGFDNRTGILIIDK